MLVLGGGSAGLTAAVAASRDGAAVVLVERSGFLGGMGTASLVHTFCGLYLVQPDPDTVIANPGLGAEIADRMQQATGVGPVRIGRVDVLPQHPLEFVRLADELVAAEKSIELLLNTEAVAVRREGDSWLIEVSCRGRQHLVRAAAIIDASGDAVLAAMLGEESEMSELGSLQRPAYVFGVAGLGELLDEEHRLRLAQRLVAGVHDEQLDAGVLGTSFRSSGRPGEAFVTIDLVAGGDRYDPTDPSCLALVEIEGRRLASSMLGWLANLEPAWRDAFVSCWPMRAGVRESRRWRGRHVLSTEQWLTGTQFEDQVAVAAWPMEFRRDNRGPKLRFGEGAQPCGIPLGCLQAKDLERVFIAGRCVSVDADVQASVRVMGTCFATGEAAGQAAVRSVRGE